VGKNCNRITKCKIAGNINCEDKKVRLLAVSSSRAKQEKLLFHFDTEVNVNKISIIWRLQNGEVREIIPRFLTKNCDNMDTIGFCKGHEITREEFDAKYCDGVEPKEG